MEAVFDCSLKLPQVTEILRQLRVPHVVSEMIRYSPVIKNSWAKVVRSMSWDQVSIMRTPLRLRRLSPTFNMISLSLSLSLPPSLPPPFSRSLHPSLHPYPSRSICFKKLTNPFIVTHSHFKLCIFKFVMYSVVRFSLATSCTRRCLTRQRNYVECSSTSHRFTQSSTRQNEMSLIVRANMWY